MLLATQLMSQLAVHADRLHTPAKPNDKVGRANCYARSSAGVDYDGSMKADELLLPKWRADPYPLYAELRAAGPIHFVERMDSWVLTRYSDVSAGLRDLRLSSRRGSGAFSDVPKAREAEVAPFKQSLRHWVLFRDPPDHTQVRTLLNKGFLPAIIDSLRPKIQGLVEELLKTPTEKRELEVVGELAYPLPAIVIAEMIGVPREDRDRFKHWSDDLAMGLAPGLKEPHAFEAALKSWQQMDKYLSELVAARRREKQQGKARHDVLSALLFAEEKGALLSEEEVRATLGLLLFAGHETTTNLITNGMLLLLRHPEALSALRKDPALMPAAIEEMLRYESPVQMLSRFSTEELTLAGQRVGKGQMVMLLMASANRDPAQFPEPDRFDITRRENRHLSFGMGVHFCLGAALARIEAQAAFRYILDHWPSIRLAEEPPAWQNNLVFRSLPRLRIAA